MPWLLEGVHVLRNVTAVEKLIWESGRKGGCVYSSQDSFGFLSLEAPPIGWALLGNHALSLQELPDFCARALPTCPASALGEVVVSLAGVIQCEVQDTLWEQKSLWGLAKPFPAKHFFSHQLLSTNKLTSLCSGGYKICSTEKMVLE